MAREQRRDVDYFPHECTHGRKMHIIEDRYGNDGYATWFKLLEQLGKANNHYIDISDEMDQMFLSSTFKISIELMMNILKDLARLKSIDKYLFETYQVVYSQKFSSSVEDAYRNRKGTIFQYNDVLNEIIKNKGQSSARLNEKEPNLTEVIPKEEKSILKDSKEKEIEKQKKFSYKKSLLELTSNEDLIDDYIMLRKDRKASLSKTAFNSLKDECEENNFPIDKALTIAIERNWIGFKVKWVEKINQITDNGKSINNTGSGSNSGYQLAKVDPERTLQRYSTDIANGNIPGVYHENISGD